MRDLFDLELQAACAEGGALIRRDKLAAEAVFAALKGAKMDQAIPVPAQVQLAKAEREVAAAEVAFNTARSALERYDEAIAQALARVEADEVGYRASVREIVRDALGDADSSLYQRVSSKVKALFSKSASAIGPDPRVSAILSAESKPARVKLQGRVELAAEQVRQASLVLDGTKLDLLAAQISEGLASIGPLLLQRGEILARRNAEVGIGAVGCASPQVAPEVAEALLVLRDETSWIRGQDNAGQRANVSRQRFVELGFAEVS